MQDLRLVGVQEDGQHLLLAAPDGTHYRVALDEPLRAAVRHDRPRLGQLQIEMEGGMRPREVQSLIRAGATAEEVADRSGWSVDKVRRYEGPILAERVHVADQARLVRVRSRGGPSGSTVPTLQARVVQRMRERGVDADATTWDAWRGVEDTHWTVALTFAAGGRQRQASWSYDPVLRTVEAGDDEARWLSADEPAAVGPAASATPRATNVYDVEAEGGVAATRRAGAAARPSREEEPLDLMTAMRQRTTVGRRSGRRRGPSTELAHPEVAAALPLDEAADAVLGSPVETPVEEPPTDLVDVSHERAGGDVEDVVGDVEDVVGRDEDIVGSDDDADHTENADTADAEPMPEPPGADVAPLDGPDDEVDDEVDAELDAEVDAGSDDADLDQTELPPAPEAKATRRQQRPSVPSWDDIMFGAKRQ